MKSFILCCSLTASVVWAQGVITTVAGTAHTFANVQPALGAPLGYSTAVAIDPNGNVFISDFVDALVLKLDRSGILTVVAGNGFTDLSGDNGPAANASFAQIGIAVDAAGNVLVADAGNNRIRKVTPDGIITTVAGNGVPDFSGDGHPAIEASLKYPSGVALDAAGNLYILDAGNDRVRKVTPDGIIKTIAGNGDNGYSGDGVPATATALALSTDPNLTSTGLAVDSTGNVYISDTFNHRVRKVGSDGIIHTIAGTGSPDFSGDEGPALAASLSGPNGLALDAFGNLFIADSFNNRIRMVNPAGTIKTVAGDGSPAVLGIPWGVAVDQTGNLFVADTFNSRVRKVSTGGNITTVAGEPSPALLGDGRAATLATLYAPTDVAVDSAGRLYIADTGNNRIRMVTPDGVISTVAGNGRGDFCGDGGLAVNACLYQPGGVAVDAKGNLYIGDTFNNRVRVVTPAGVIRTVAGNGNPDFTGDNGPAILAAMNNPFGVAVDNAGNIYVADVNNNRIRKVTADGIITTVAGNGDADFSGDDGPASSASLDTPYAVAVNAAGTLFITDSGNNRIRMVTAAGIIKTVAGNDRAGFTGDGPATSVSLYFPVGITVDSSNNLLIADEYNDLVRKVTPDGIMTTVAGNLLGQLGCGPLRDGGPATSASLCFPAGVAVDHAGNIFIADDSYFRVREVLVSPPAVTASPVTLAFEGRAGGPVSTSQAITVVAPLVPGIPFDVSIDSKSSAWLSADVVSGNTPRLIQVTADPFSLTPGQYSGIVTIKSPLATPTIITIPVTLSVTPGIDPALSVDRPSISFTFPRGSSKRAETIRVANTGGGSLSFTVSASTGAGGNWLTVSPASGSATPSRDVALTVTADPTALRPGTYTGTVVVRGTTLPATVQIPVTMTISSNPSALLLSQTGLSFTAIEGGGVIPSQNFGVIDLGTQPLSFSLGTSTMSGGSWLSAVQSAVGSSADVNVDSSHLAAGRYYGLVQVLSPGTANSPQLVTIHLEVLARGTDLGGVAQPSELIFNSSLASGSPSSQRVFVYNPTALPKTFRVVPSENWLGVRPEVASVAPNQPVQLTIQPFTGGLEVGTHRSTVSLQFDDGRVRELQVTVVVTSSASVSQAARRNRTALQTSSDNGCQATQLLPLIANSAAQFPVSGGWPVALQTQVQDDCGNPLEDGSVVASFSNTDPPLTLRSQTGGRWDATWQTGKNPKGVTITVKASTSSGLVGLKQVTIGFGDDAQSPSISEAGVTVAAGGLTSRPLSPGAFIGITGDRLADLTLASPRPFADQLANVSVIVAGQRVPIASTAPNLILGILPYGIETNTRQQLVVSRGTTYSQPVSINLADASPAIFTTTETQGNVVNATGQLVSPQNPATTGDLVTIYCDGLGALTSGETAGGYGPASSTTKNPVTVSIGGKDAAVSFNGLAPGLVGVYMVQATVPQGVTGGDQIPVTITSLTDPPVVSPVVTIAVR